MKILQVTDSQSLDRVLAFVWSIFPHFNSMEGKYGRDFWLSQWARHPELLLYAEEDGQIVGSAFAWEDGGDITVGHLAVAEGYRKQGLGRELMEEAEKRVWDLGFTHIGLGSVESAEGFYAKLGYSGVLLVQSDRHTVEELLSLEQPYPLQGTNVYEGTISQLYIRLPLADRALQRQYEETFPGCSTQMIYDKDLTVDRTARRVARIDSGEAGIFREYVNTSKAYLFHTWPDGVFFACEYGGKLRVHIVVDTDTDAHNGEAASLLRTARERAGEGPANIWLWGENHNLTDYLADTFQIKPNCGPYHYGSYEMIRRHRDFLPQSLPEGLRAELYQPERLQEYLTLLDEAMAFEQPGPAYRAGAEHFAKFLAERAADGEFEAFRLGDDLAGLYWRKNAEIDHIAVHPRLQRRGIGGAMLNRAFERAFAATGADYCYLYVVDWNEQAHNFYRKMGLEENGHSKGLEMK